MPMDKWLFPAVSQALPDKCHDIDNPVLRVKSVTTLVTQSCFECLIFGQSVLKNMNKLFSMIHLKVMDLRHDRCPYIRIHKLL